MRHFKHLFIWIASAAIAPAVHAGEPTVTVAQEGVVNIATNALRWDFRSFDSAYFHFYVGRKPAWQFAPCTRPELSQITLGDIRREFYGPDDLGGPVAFPNRWTEQSVIVSPNEIILARSSSQPETVYALKPSFQRDKSLRLTYVALRAASPDAAPSDAKEKKPIPSLTIGGATYANVAIESITDKTITFTHARGVGSVNPQKLTANERQALGLQSEIPKEQKAEVIESKTTTSAWNIKRRVGMPDSISQFARMAGAIALGIVLAVIAFYLFTCLCLMRICNKTDHPAPLLVWIPLLQIFALYRAAGMSSFWFKTLIIDIVFRLGIAGLAVSGFVARDNNVQNGVVIFICVAFTVIHVIGWCVWCFKICIAREKHPLLGFFVFFPITQPPALAYLAFSK